MKPTEIKLHHGGTVIISQEPGPDEQPAIIFTYRNACRDLPDTVLALTYEDANALGSAIMNPIPLTAFWPISVTPVQSIGSAMVDGLANLPLHVGTYGEITALPSRAEVSGSAPDPKSRG